MGSSSYQPPRRPSSGAAPRIIEDRETLRRQLSSDDSIARTHPALTGAMVGLQGLLAGIILIVLPVLLTSVVSTTLVDQDFNFGRALRFGGAFWSSANGGYLQVAHTTLTLVPLGLTLLVLLGLRLATRRGLDLAWSAITAYTAVYCLGITLVSALVGVHGAGIVRVMFGSAALSLLAAYLGQRREAGLSPFQQVFSRVPQWIRHCVVSGIAGFLLVVILAALSVLAWFLLGRDSMSNVLSGWSLDAMSGLALGIAQLSLVPNLMVWAAAWMSGAGFVVGSDTIVSPHEVVLGPLPNIPVLASIPEAAVPGSFALIFLLALGLAAGLPALKVARANFPMKTWQIVVAPVISACVFAISWLAVAWWGSGSLGPGRLTDIGVHVWATLPRMFLIALIPTALLIWLARRETIAWVSLKIRRNSGPTYAAQESTATSKSSSAASGSSAVSASSSSSSASAASADEPEDHEDNVADGEGPTAES